jgi:hypothetical protein
MVSIAKYHPNRESPTPTPEAGGDPMIDDWALIVEIAAVVALVVMAAVLAMIARSVSKIERRGRR